MFCLGVGSDLLSLSHRSFVFAQDGFLVAHAASSGERPVTWGLLKVRHTSHNSHHVLSVTLFFFFINLPVFSLPVFGWLRLPVCFTR